MLKSNKKTVTDISFDNILVTNEKWLYAGNDIVLFKFKPTDVKYM